MLELLIGIAAWAGLAAFCILLLAHYRAEYAARRMQRADTRSAVREQQPRPAADGLDTAA